MPEGMVCSAGYRLFYWRLTMPQPLGAPKLLQGLGLVAGSLRPGTTVSNQGETVNRRLGASPSPIEDNYWQKV